MRIYIRVDEDFFGSHAWLYADGLEIELVDRCFHIDGSPWATCFTSIKSAKAYAKHAKKMMAETEGFWKVSGKHVIVSYWRLVRGKLVKTRFTKDNKIRT